MSSIVEPRLRPIAFGSTLANHSYNSTQHCLPSSKSLDLDPNILHFLDLHLLTFTCRRHTSLACRANFTCKAHFTWRSHTSLPSPLPQSRQRAPSQLPRRWSLRSKASPLLNRSTLNHPYHYRAPQKKSGLAKHPRPTLISAQAPKKTYPRSLPGGRIGSRSFHGQLPNLFF